MQLVLTQRRRHGLPLADIEGKGKAPYFKTLARSAASSWVNCPVIEACPPMIGSLTWGAEITTPSSTMANWSVGGEPD